MTKTILEILKSLGIYDRAREKFDSDEQLAKCFDRDFDELVAMFVNP